MCTMHDSGRTWLPWVPRKRQAKLRRANPAGDKPGDAKLFFSSASSSAPIVADELRALLSVEDELRFDESLS